MKLSKTEPNLTMAAANAGTDEKLARDPFEWALGISPDQRPQDFSNSLIYEIFLGTLSGPQ